MKGELKKLEVAVERVLNGEGRKWGKAEPRKEGLQDVIDVKMGVDGC